MRITAGEPVQKGQDREDAQPVLSASLELRLRAEQINLLFRNLPSGIIATIINAVILTYIQWDVLSHAALLTWCGAVMVISVSRYVLTLAYRRAEVTPERARIWGHMFITGTISSGIAWGSAAVFLFPSDLAHQVFVIFVLAGMTAGAVVSFSALMGVAIMFVVPTLTPLIVRLFIEGHDVHLAMGTMAMVFLVLILVTAQRMYHTTRDSLMLRFKNSDLIEHLATEKEATEALNRNLQQEIAERIRVEQGLRESEERIHAIFDNVPDGIITISENGQIESMNPAARWFFGYEPGEAYGKHVGVLMAAQDRGDYETHFKDNLKVTNGRVIGFGLEITGERKDGTQFPMEFGLTEMWLDRRRMFIGIARDITERKKVDRMKSQFIAAVSHELRTPLTSVLSSLDLFADGVAGELTEQGQSLLNIAHKNMERLVRQINDILDMDDVQQGKMRLDLRPMDIAMVVKKTIEDNRDRAAEQGLEIVLQADATPKVHGDSIRLAHVLNHLLSNAIKFSPPGGRIEVGLTVTDDSVRVSVADHGPGIPEQFQIHVFQPFTSGETPQQGRRGGAGLGLSIAKAIVEKHGGTIGFDTDPDQGTCFYFDLPPHR